MSALICGSLAYDNIMRFDGRFRDSILADQLHKLSVSFYVPHLQREFGGCAGNIAYSLSLLGGTPLPMATLGHDGAAYLSRLDALGISTRHILTVEGTVSAQAMILTDNDNNQITAFHPGAMAHAQLNTISADLKNSADVKLGIVSPDGRDGMLEHAAQLKAADIPFVFDPGQGLPMFDAQELAAFIAQATWISVNEYEAHLLSERTGWSAAQIASRVKGYIITLGEKGVEVWEGNRAQTIPAATPTHIVDPTGCGDAWRGALLFGLEKNWPLAQCAQLGNKVAALKIAQAGGQNYRL